MGHIQPAKVKIRLRGLQSRFVAFARMDDVTILAFARDMTSRDHLPGPNHDTAAFANGITVRVNHVHRNHGRRDSRQNSRFGCLPRGIRQRARREQRNEKVFRILDTHRSRALSGKFNITTYHSSG